jgi:hypothetical protein
VGTDFARHSLIQSYWDRKHRDAAAAVAVVVISINGGATASMSPLHTSGVTAAGRG